MNFNQQIYICDEIYKDKMKENNQDVTQIYNKFVYRNKSPKGWSIVIIPDKILINNFHHGFAHIHPDRKEIKTDNLNDTFIIVLNHIHINKAVDYEKLREELIK